MPDVNQPNNDARDVDDTPRIQDVARHTRLRWPWGLVAALVLVLAGSGSAWWFMGRPAQQAKVVPAPMQVPVITVKASVVPIYRSFPARMQAMRTVTIQARVTGYLVQQAAPDGADVTEGALLYRIDAKDYQAAFIQAQAQLAGANANLRYARVSNGRNQALARDGWVSRDTADATTSAFNQGRASVANSHAALDESALSLSRTEIRAPFAGRIGESQVFQGSLISVAGATLNTLVQLDPIYVSFNPAEPNLVAIVREQARAPIQTSVAVGDGGLNHTGSLSFIDNQVSQSTGTILVRATIANPDHDLLPGQYATARLHLGDLQGALLVPQEAVGASQIGRTILVVVPGDKVEQRIVTLGDNYGENVVAVTGLKAGDRVITGQLQKLKPGMLVRPTEKDSRDD